MNAKVKVHSEKEVTVNDLAQEAKTIFGKVKSGTHYNDIETAHRQFCTSYPIVIRYMIEHSLYSEKAFRLHLKTLTNSVNHSEDDYLDAQARYISSLYTNCNKRPNPKEASKIRSEAFSSLKREHEEFKKVAEEVKKEVEENEERMKLHRSKVLKSLTGSLPDRDIIQVHMDPSLSTDYPEIVVPEVNPGITTSDFLD